MSFEQPYLQDPAASKLQTLKRDDNSLAGEQREQPIIFNKEIQQKPVYERVTPNQRLSKNDKVMIDKSKNNKFH